MVASDKANRWFLLIGLTLGCGAKGGADDLSARLATACEQTSNLGAAMCRCVGEKAKADLSPEALRLLVALVEKDDAAIEAARRTASLPDAATAGTFMVRAPAACGRQGVTVPPSPEDS